MQLRDRGIAQSLGLPLLQRVKTSRVLLVGAGGIGCEVLKNLVCCGFGSSGYSEGLENGAQQEQESTTNYQRKSGIVVIDLDTIDLSNLNRQFLFRKHHIKKPKAFVAKDTASQFNPAVHIDAHHASIFDKRYNVDFFGSFDLVFNALDNLAARRHVNRMCLAVNVPLIESGTTGFNGQVQAIQRGLTECYDCNEKPVQKSFPICTIRSTPSQPIHCIVWAKSYLLPELFGTSEEDSNDMAVTEGDNAEEVAKLRQEAEALKQIRSLMGKSEFAQHVFDKVFHEDIERLRSMSEMWQSRKPPQSIRFADLKPDTDLVESGRALTTLHQQRIWSPQENLAVFCHSVEALSKRVEAGETVIQFDKDDQETLDFVASAANLRSHVFGIQQHSEWEIKEMAGNIIPAIATSNALTAGLCVLEAFKIIRAQVSTANGLAHPATNHHLSHTVNGKEEPLLGGAKMVFLNSRSTERIITTQCLSPPNPTCPVCSPTYAKLSVQAGSSATLQNLVDLLKSTVGYDDLTISTEIGVVFDPDLDDNLDKPLQDLGIDQQGNGFVTVTDEADEPKQDLVLSVFEAPTSSPAQEGTGGLRLLPEQLSLPLKPKKAAVTTNGHVNGHSEVDSELVEPSRAGAKRKREAEEDVQSARTKKARPGAGQEVYVVEDDGAILLDD